MRCSGCGANQEIKMATTKITIQFDATQVTTQIEVRTESLWLYELGSHWCSDEGDYTVVGH